MRPRIVMLAGGQGSRLLPYRTIVPKPLMPVGDRAVLELMLRQVARCGFGDVTLAVGDLAPLIQAMFGDGGRLGVRLHYCQEHEPHGTAGVLAEVDIDGPFILMNGNVLTTLDLGELVQAHEDSGAAITVATHERVVTADFGVIELGGGAELKGGLMPVCGYADKPVTRHSVSMGVYAMQPVVREFVAPGEYLGLPDLVHRVLDAGLSVMAYPFDGLWLDLRRREDYEVAVARYDEIAPHFLEPAVVADAA